MGLYIDKVSFINFCAKKKDPNSKAERVKKPQERLNMALNEDIFRIRTPESEERAAQNKDFYEKLWSDLTLKVGEMRHHEDVSSIASKMFEYAKKEKQGIDIPHDFVDVEYASVSFITNLGTLEDLKAYTPAELRKKKIVITRIRAVSDDKITLQIPQDGRLITVLTVPNNGKKTDKKKIIMERYDRLMTIPPDERNEIHTEMIEGIKDELKRIGLNLDTILKERKKS